MPQGSPRLCTNFNHILVRSKKWASCKMELFDKRNLRTLSFTIRSHPKFITLSVVLAVFTDVILYGIIVPIFPFALEKRVNIHPEDVQQWITILLGVYGLGMLLGSPAFGHLADTWQNRRTPLLGGLMLLLTSTLLLWFSHNIVFMLIGRFLQGLSCACVWSVGLALIVDTMGAEDSGLSIGIATMATSSGFVIAPTIGGLIYHQAGYNAVFICCISLVTIDIILRLLLIEKAEAESYLRDQADPDILQPLLPAEPEPPRKRDTTIPQVPTMIVLLKSPRFLQSLLVGSVYGAILTSFEATLPLHLKEIFDFTPEAVGLMFVALIIPGVVAPWIGQAASKKGPKWFVTSGFVLMAINIFMLRLPHSDHSEAKVLTFMLLLFVGLGVVFVNSPNMLDTGLAVRELEKNNPGIFGDQGAMAQAFGLENVAFAMGTIWGPLFAGFIKDVGGWSVMTTALGTLCTLVAIPSAILTGGMLRLSKPKDEDCEAEGGSSCAR